MSSENASVSARSEGDARPSVTRAERLAKATKATNVIFCTLYALILMVFLLDLFGADPQNPFVQFWGLLAEPLLAPFRGVVWSPRFADYQVTGACMAALVIYVVVHQTITAVLELVSLRRSNS